jgi:magnesium-transporting ATPase (P-type)
MGIEAVRSKMLKRTKDLVLTDIPFDSQFKRATTVVLRPDGSVRVYTKGAPDVLYGKDKKTVDEKVKLLRQQNPRMSEPEAVARAEKMAGYGMINRV